MSSPLRKTHPIFSVMNNAVVDLPAPSNLSVWWNFGSLLGLCLGVQIITGLFLSMHYAPNVELAFSSVAHTVRDVDYGWMMRNLHANGGSWFFICLYLHIGRGIYYGSYMYVEVWNIGIVILLLTMGTAFFGYVLPWGQMSFWGATVITNLASAIPYIGKAIVEWVWGGFAVDNATLNRFFAFHFVLPFIIAAMVIIHLLFLHQTGSNNSLGLNSNVDKVPFDDYYTSKDVVGFLVMLMLFVFMSMFVPNLLGDPENFIPASPLVTPIHIAPEWYFLFAYAILRSIPNKLGGVVAMFAAILMLFVLPLSVPSMRWGVMFYPVSQVFFWSFICVFLLLTWIGGRPVESPYEGLGQVFTCLYFVYYLMAPMLVGGWNKLI